MYDDLLERIRSGKIRPGERLPAEKALAEEFDVSRITIQKAMSMLVQDGYIVRRPGRGSFTSMNAGKADAKSGERGTDAGGMSRVIGLVMEEFTASFGIEMLTVSYTHLDVYKRQQTQRVLIRQSEVG